MGSRHSMFLVFVLTICGTDAASGAPPPCSLLTPAQVSSVLGLHAGAGQPIGTKVCGWSGQEEKGKGGETVTVTLLNAQEFAVAKVPLNKNTRKAPVSGLGDEAIYSTIGKLGTLAVRKGNVAFLIRAYGVPYEQIEGKEKALAADVLSRL